MKRIALLVLLCVSSLAQADSKAWTAGKKIIPSNVFGVVGIDANAIRSSELYKQLLPALLSEHADVKDHFGEIQTTCGVDATGAIDSVVVGVSEAGKGTIVVALKGVNQKAVEGCFTKLAKAHGKAMTAEKSGDLVRYHMDGDKDLYFRWLSSDTFAIATEPDNKDSSQAAIAGGLTGNKELAPMLTAVKTNAPMWFAFAKSQNIDQFQAKMTGFYGTIDFKTGNVLIDFHIALDSDKGATALANGATKMLPVLAQQVPPTMAALASSVVIKAAGKEVIATAQAADKDLVAAVQQFVVRPAPPPPVSSPVTPVPTKTGKTSK
jgi:hypothetical protein